MEIHQLLPTLWPGDAIGNHTRGLQKLLRAWGHTSHIYAGNVHVSLRDVGKFVRDYRPGPDTVTIYHYSIADPVSDLFLKAPGKKALIYHNITPAHFFAQYDEDSFHLTKEGRERLADFKDVVQLALGDSAYNCRELAEVGYRDPQVLPILIDFDEFAATRPSPLTLGLLDDGWVNFLFVSRVMPHKRQDDVLRVFAHYNRTINRASRLILVGGFGSEEYIAALRRIARKFDLEQHVLLTNSISFPELIAFYRKAHVFVCMSEHEGFGVPLVEAMLHDVPVIGYKAAGVPDTLGGAGVLVADKHYPTIAELAHLLISDTTLRERVLQRQRQRLADFHPERTAIRFKAYVEQIRAA